MMVLFTVLQIYNVTLMQRPNKPATRAKYFRGLSGKTEHVRTSESNLILEIFPETDAVSYLP